MNKSNIGGTGQKGRGLASNSQSHGGERSKDHHCKHRKAPAMMIRLECANTQSSPPFRRGQEGRRIKLTCGYCCSNLGLSKLIDK